MGIGHQFGVVCFSIELGLWGINLRSEPLSAMPCPAILAYWHLEPRKMKSGQVTGDTKGVVTSKMWSCAGCLSFVTGVWVNIKSPGFSNPFQGCSISDPQPYALFQGSL